MSIGERIKLQQGELTEMDVDAIVNAANEALLVGGGVDGAIHDAAGPELLAACLAIPEVRPGVRCPTGEARVTPAFRLPVQYVIHAVGPFFRGTRGSRPARERFSSRAAAGGGERLLECRRASHLVWRVRVSSPGRRAHLRGGLARAHLGPG